MTTGPDCSFASRRGHRLPPAPRGRAFKQNPRTPHGAVPSPFQCLTGTPGAQCKEAKRDVGPTASHPPPRRQRETIFRGPRMQGLTSFPHIRRRPRLAGTPSGVSDAGRHDCRHKV